MKKTVLAYGIILALLVLLIKWLDYRFFVQDLSLEIYIGIIATLFAVLGIWMGLKLTKPKVVFAASSEPFIRDDNRIQSLGLSVREMEVLQLMADGNSNQEIADALFISLNTVKTHTSSLFSKLNVNKRTKAVQYARDQNLIP